MANFHGQRREFLRQSAALGIGMTLPVWAWADDQARLPTPAQTAGPFYPVPAIEKQKFNDTDLTRKLGKDEVAKGQIILVNGVIKDLTGKPLKSAVVEIWQACTTGKYNHRRDRNPAVQDDKFQFWGRMLTDEEGQYEFRTIKPGKYPGRTPHIHFQIVANNYRKLVTQLYFSDESKANAKDGIYRRLKSKERDLVTTELTKSKDDKKQEVVTGKFDVYLGKNS